MSFESYSHDCAESFESHRQIDDACAVSREEWSRHSSIKSDSSLESQAMVDDGTLPILSFTTEEPLGSDEQTSIYHNSNDCAEKFSGADDACSEDDCGDLPCDQQEGHYQTDGTEDGDEGKGEVPPERKPPEGGTPLEGGMGTLAITGDGIPPELMKYAHMEGDTLVIDAHGEQLPPLDISRDNVVIKNARINGAGADSAIHITGSHVQVLGSEITGGQAGITAERASDVTVSGNNIHDFEGGQAITFNGVDGGAISDNKVSGYYPNDAINMLGSSNLKVMNNDINVTVDGMGAPLMVEDGGFSFNTHSHDIEVAGNKITYSGGVPPGLLGGYNLIGHDNLVNGDASAEAWQLYHYQSDDRSFPSVWYNVYYNGQRYS